MANHHTSLEKVNGQKTIQSYVLGFTLAIILTVIAFALVNFRLLSNSYTYTSLGVLAFLQLFVQSVCFLRLNNQGEGKWNLLPFLFTLMIIAIFVGGSLWIMYNLNYNMT